MTTPPYVGARARIPSIDRRGTIEFIDWPRLYVHAAYAIQVALDEEWRGGRVWRTNVRDCEILNNEEES